jgi:hypothetical protein
VQGENETELTNQRYIRGSGTTFIRNAAREIEMPRELR